MNDDIYFRSTIIVFGDGIVMSIIAHNMLASYTQRQLNINTKRKAKTAEKLASGYRVNRAADDAASLSISEKMRFQIRGLNQGCKNVEDGIGMIRTADGALDEVLNILHRMKELSVQAANDTNETVDRLMIQNELDLLKDDIDRIGKTTNFNGQYMLDGMEDHFLEEDGSITRLVSSPAADTGYLTEALKVGSNYYPASSLDFSGITSANINLLNGCGFSFNCSMNCDEVFDIRFATDGTPSSATNLSGQVKHNYVVDISGCSSGLEVVDAVYGYVSAHLPSTAGKIIGDSVGVSHSNNLMKNGNKLYVFSTSGYSSSSAAQSAFPNSSKPNSGKIDCSSLAIVTDEDKVCNVNIQCSGVPEDDRVITFNKMNATLIGVGALKVDNHSHASGAISSIDFAVNKINSQRSKYGAYENRLEMVLRNNENYSENLQDAESRIRDANMAEEVMTQAKQSILEQAATAMLSQNSKNTENILQLLQ